MQNEKKQHRIQRRIERDTNRTSTFGAAHVMEHEIILISKTEKKTNRERDSPAHTE